MHAIRYPRVRGVAGGEAASIAMVDAAEEYAAARSRGDGGAVARLDAAFRGTWERIRDRSFEPVAARADADASSGWGVEHERCAVRDFADFLSSAGADARGHRPAGVEGGRCFPIRAPTGAPWLFCTPDAIVVDRDRAVLAVVEAKCPVAPVPLERLVPRRSHLVQVLLQMRAAYARDGYIVFWTPAGSVVWRVPRDDATTRLIVDGLYRYFTSAWWARWEQGSPPDPDDVFARAGGVLGLARALDASLRRCSRVSVIAHASK